MSESATRQRGMTPEDILALRWIADAQLSADGRQVAFTATTLDAETDEYRAAIWTVAADGSQPARQLSSGAARDGEPRWSPDGRWLAFTSSRDGGKSQLYLLPASGGEAVRLTDLELGVSGPVWSPDSRRLCVVGKLALLPKPDEQSKVAPPARVITSLTYKLNGEGFTYDKRRHLFVIDLPEPGGAPSEPRQLTDGDWNDVSPAWSPDGRSIAFVSARHENREFDHVLDIFTVNVESGATERLTDGSFALDGAPAWRADGGAIAFLGFRQPEDAPRHDRLWTLTLRDRELRCVSEGYDRLLIGSPRWSADGSALYCIAADRGAAPIVRFVARGGAPSVIAAAGRMAAGFSLGGDDTVAFVASEPSAPAEVFIATSSGEFRLSGLNDCWLRAVDLPAPRRLLVHAADGTEIDAWLIRPHGYVPGGAHPLLVNMHGGPFAQYGETFLDEFGVQSGAGFGVLYCNPRGSSGRDEAFARSIIGCTGEADAPDVLAALDHALAHEPDIDATRLGLLGGSYGGYLTNWLLGHTGRFAAACSERSISNRLSKAGTDDVNTTWTYFRQEPFRETELLLRLSPIMYAESMTTPLLLMHSEEDLRCPIEQAEQLFTALRRLRRDVVFVRFPGENHELSRAGKPSHRIERFRLQLDFFRSRMALADAAG